MTKTTQLQARPRSETGKEVARRLRSQGRIPAVLYGKDMEARALSLDLQETVYLFQHIQVENTIVDLVVEGDSEPVQTLIREIQTYPDKAGLLHVDFLRIQKGVAVEVEIPIHLEGTAHGVREGGGILEQQVTELRVRCIPSRIPDRVALDVTGLGLGDSLHVSDVELEEGVEILMDAERTICTVAMPRIVAAAEGEEEDEEEGMPGEEAEEETSEEA